ncbi:hypothetical protein [Streptomyces sp. H39-S7]|uniref:hypothetical protein n=1 Tax=Streptomyces sp. H39-S7 TaxID=3004357 RepID=UPI0022AFD3A5|nr:hypothetical protein [Streptomyces sp. H39-S7]MCZ4123650.1 hypothetical protein [Streptomyces sp. H39-S7]
MSLPLTAPELAEALEEQELVLEGRPGCVERYGEQSAQRLFTRAFVATVQWLAGLGPLACAARSRAAPMSVLLPVVAR